MARRAPSAPAKDAQDPPRDKAYPGGGGQNDLPTDPGDAHAASQEPKRSLSDAPPAPAPLPNAPDASQVPPAKPPYPRFDDLGPNAPTFSEYFDRHVAAIRGAQGIMARSLSDDPVEMDVQIRETEARLCTMRSIEAWADSYLDVAENVALSKMPGRSSDWTDLDRNKALAAAVARERRFRDVVRGIRESIETRISYGQSRLRFVEGRSS